MTSGRTAVVVLGGGPAALAAARSAEELEVDEVVVRDATDHLPWNDVSAEVVRFLRAGDDPLPCPAVPDALAVDHAVVGSCRTKGPGAWGGHLSPTAGRSADPALLLARLEPPLSAVAVRAEALPTTTEVAPGEPGGVAWLLARITAEGGTLGTVEGPLATVAPLPRDHRVHALAALGSTELAARLGAAHGIRKDLLESTCLAGPDAPRPPHGWWRPILDRGDAGQVADLVVELEWALDRQGDRMRSLLGDPHLDGIDAAVAEAVDTAILYETSRLTHQENVRLSETVAWLHAEVAARDARIGELESRQAGEP
ncbi:hypothetical protein [Actinomarinicola tropica]|uniref:hypothetical protein n=1 Tax=Actinomarinicola tropica TaxID=2789776 RepID=UPI00189793FA|nr:hypothetical protein [Actinomarinicola tropica]